MGDHRLAYVLLVGDTFDPARNVLLPLYYITSGPLVEYRAFACDGAYALLTETDPVDDLFPDVYVGRLPVDADTAQWEITNAVNRILNYEPVPANANWINKALMFSGEEDSGYSFEGQGLSGFQAFFDSTVSRYIPSNVTVSQIHDLDPAFTYDTDCSAAFADSLRSGFGLVGLFDHGDFFYLRGKSGQGAPLPVDYDSLGTDRAPFVINLGSHMGECDYTVDKRDSLLWGGQKGPCVPSLSGSCVIEQRDAHIDSCDVMAERLVVQGWGAIGVLAFNRSCSTLIAEAGWNYFWDTQYSENVTTSGQELLLNKLAVATRFTGPEAFQWIGGLSLFGDPAVNLRWRDIANDGSDLAIRNSDIPMQYLPTSGGLFHFVVRNEGPQTATDVGVEVWRGEPDLGSSTLLGSVSIDTVSAYDTTMVNVTVSAVPEGKVRLYVRVNADSTIAEPTYDNNTSYGYCLAYPYVSSFPVVFDGTSHHGAMLVDVSGSSGSEVLLATQTRLNCYAASGTLLWSFCRGTPTVRTGPLVANFGKDGTPVILWETAGYAYLLNPGSGGIIDSTFVGTPPSSTYQSYAVGDLVKGDENLEYIGHYGAWFEAHEPDGTLLWQVSPTSSYDQAGIAVGDIDGDGTSEVMISTGLTLRVCNGQTGTTVWQAPLGTKLMLNELVAFDADGDGDMEILSTSSTGSFSPAVSLYDHAGSPLWTHCIGTSIPKPIVSMAIGDLHRTGTPDILVGGLYAIRRFDASGALMDSVHTDLGVNDGLLIGDITGDSDLEVVAAGEKSIEVFDANFAPVDTLYFAGALSGGIAIGDVDGDGTCDLVVATADGFLHVMTVGTKSGELPWPMNDNNPMHTSIYAQPLVGHYTHRMSLFNTVHVIGDVEADSSVYIDGAAHVRVSNSDVTSGGEDTSRSELVVKGHLNAVGSELERVVIDGWDGVTTDSHDDAWYGISISDTTSSGRGLFDHVDLRGAARGIWTHEPLTVRNCVIENCADRGINAAFADTVVVDSTTIRGSDYGINALQGTTILLSNSLIEDCSMYGVAAYKNSFLWAKDTTYDGNDIGVYVAAEGYAWAKAMIRTCTMTNNDSGIWIDDTGDSTVVVNLCTIDGNTTNGIYVEDGGDVLLTRNTISDGSTGIFSYHSGPKIVRSNHITGNGNGIKCDASSYAAVESCQVDSNNFGITVVDGNPNIGTYSGGTSSGYNILKPNTTYNLRNLTAYTISAQQNYWPQKTTCAPKPSTLYGPIDATYALCSKPSLTSPGPGQRENPELSLPHEFGLSQNYPNPFNPTTTIDFEVATPTTVRINIYNVSGGLVAVLVDEVKRPGTYSAKWNGRNRYGQPVASGIYFVRMQAGTFSTVKKLLLLK